MQTLDSSQESRLNPEGLISTALLGEPAFAIQCSELKGSFLMQLITSSDTWAFIGSNGAITAGRKNPDHALFPYYTQDKLFDMKATSGSCTIIRCSDPVTGHTTTWLPFHETPDRPDHISRRVIKSLSGSKIAVEETHGLLGLTIRVTWSSSNPLGILRQTRLSSISDSARTVQVVDGIMNILPASVDQQFQNEFSILVDAYKRNEWFEPALATYSLSSVPTDKAEPSESMRATSVWSTGFPGSGHLLCMDQLSDFCKGNPLSDESETRGKRGAYLRHGSVQIPAKAHAEWWVVADMDQSAAKTVNTLYLLKSGKDLRQLIENSIHEDSEKIYSMISHADGIQLTAKSRTSARHFSNALFNLMRGGTFPLGYKIPTHDLCRHIRLCNRQSYEKHKTRLEQLPEFIELSDLKKTLEGFAGPELTRIAEEYLPLTFSRRHGDPSRPWNRFSIDITDENENPIYAYQGNWRDIFQNWEALLHTFPLYTDAIISRFLNATTADGYNPYRVTKTGFEWEREEPGSPWSNIGYWGDHQIVYLLKLLEFSFKTNPQHLAGLLNKARYAFADVPYRIKPFSEILKNARASIVYDHQHSDEIDARAAVKGSDGQLLHDPQGTIIHSTLLEKLLIPLLAKLSNFVPGAGIWMNTQRPEWNDANNALAGYGASVVTLGYLHRYLEFLEHLLQTSPAGEYQLHQSTLLLFQQIHSICSKVGPVSGMTDEKRSKVVHALGQAGTEYRESCYNGTFSQTSATLTAKEAIEAITCFRISVGDSLRANRRLDALYHAYNLVRFRSNGSVAIEHLGLMLEGQVSILSSGILDLQDSLCLIKAMRTSELYRADQHSYLLYPNRNLPKFLDKGAIPTELLSKYPDIREHFTSEQGRLAQVGPDGRVRFHPSFRNAEDLNKVIAKMQLPTEQARQIHALYESTYNHHAFTGRSGTFFGYEGLGSIYWHMVSKLLLAVQEVILNHPEPSADRSELIEFYYEIRKGIGVDKTPAEYGAFPTDAYSHTPAHAGAQQPGMTGQVKEDLLVRFGELGIKLEGGSLRFAPELLTRDEFTHEPQALTYYDGKGQKTSIPVPAQAIAFTLCHTPVVYQLDAALQSPGIAITSAAGNTRRFEGAVLPPEVTESVFSRSGEIEKITVFFPLGITRS